jgi:hypothetical protein
VVSFQGRPNLYLSLGWAHPLSSPSFTAENYLGCEELQCLECAGGTSPTAHQVPSLPNPLLPACGRYMQVRKASTNKL